MSATYKTGTIWVAVSGDGLVSVRKNFLLCVYFVRYGREIKHSGVSIVHYFSKHAPLVEPTYFCCSNCCLPWGCS